MVSCIHILVNIWDILVCDKSQRSAISKVLVQRWYIIWGSDGERCEDLFVFTVKSEMGKRCELLTA